MNLITEMAVWIFGIAVGGGCVVFLAWDGYKHRRRFNRRHGHIKAKDLDPAITTGQFYIPSQFKDKKHANTHTPRW